MKLYILLRLKTLKTSLVPCRFSVCAVINTGKDLASSHCIKEGRKRSLPPSQAPLRASNFLSIFLYAGINKWRLSTSLPENHILFSGKYPFTPNNGVPPSPPPNVRKRGNMAGLDGGKKLRFFFLLRRDLKHACGNIILTSVDYSDPKTGF